MHKKDYVNSLNAKSLHKESSPNIADKVGHMKMILPKNFRGTNHDTPGLSDELDKLAVGFASDDGQESPTLFVKKASVRGRGRRPSHGIIRSHISDTKANEASAMSREQWNNQSPPSKLTANSPTGSPELSASKLLAMQKAKGLKVMPPNRRLSLAREQAFGDQASDEFADKVERLGKGVKVLKGRRICVESNSSERKTENSHGEILQSGVLKKARYVLSKVEDNGVSAEDNPEEKVVENGSLPLPKQPQTPPLQSPPVKKSKPLSPKKQSPSIGVCSLWNQDLFLS